MFVPLSIADDCHIQPEQEEEYPFTVCGQTIMLSAPFLPQPCPCCRNRGRKKYSSTTSSVRRKRKSAQGMDRPAAPQAVTSSLPCSSYGRIWRCLPMSRLLPYETIIKATHGYPEAVRTVLAHYDKYIKHFSKIDGHIYVEAEEYITQRLVESLLKFRLDRLPAFSKIASIMPCKGDRKKFCKAPARHISFCLSCFIPCHRIACCSNSANTHFSNPPFFLISAVNEN